MTQNMTFSQINMFVANRDIFVANRDILTNRDSESFENMKNIGVTFRDKLTWIVLENGTYIPPIYKCLICFAFVGNGP